MKSRSRCRRISTCPPMPTCSPVRSAISSAIHSSTRRVPVPSRFMGSPVGFAGYIALTSQDGDTFMLKAGPRHEVVRTNAVGEPVMSSPAIANGRIYIRGQKHLFAIGG